MQEPPTAILPLTTSRVSSRDRFGWLVAAAAGVIALAVYVSTLAPGLTFEHNGIDGGDLIAAARTLGIPHPTGYPAYTLLAWLFSHLPLGTIAYRVNLLSAVCAAGAVGLLCRTAQLLLPDRGDLLVLSAATALTLAFSSLLWSQAVISEVYALLALFAALLLWLLARWRVQGRARTLWAVGLVLGLGLANHLTLVLAVPAVLILLAEPGSWRLHRRSRARTLFAAAGLAVAGLSAYLYLPLAATQRPPVNWGNPQTWDRFLWMVTGKQYQTFVFGLPLEAMPGRLAAWAGMLGDQFGWWGLAIALVGAGWWWYRDRWFAISGLTWMAFVAVYAFFYDTGDSHLYLLPALFLLSLCWGAGAGYLSYLAQQARTIWRRLALAAIVALPLCSLALHWRAADVSHDWNAHAYAYQVLAGTAPDALVVVRGDGPTFALWYAVYAEGRRPDVAVVNGPLLTYAWYRDNTRHLYPELILTEPDSASATTDDLVRDLIAQNLELRPVYATDPAEAWKAWFDFVEDSEAHLYRVWREAGSDAR